MSMLPYKFQYFGLNRDVKLPNDLVSMKNGSHTQTPFYEIIHKGARDYPESLRIRTKGPSKQKSACQR